MYSKCILFFMYHLDTTLIILLIGTLSIDQLSVFLQFFSFISVGHELIQQIESIQNVYRTLILF